MMMSDQKNKGVFFDEWQACLRAHYRHVIAMNDMVTEPTLRGVLLQAGLSDDELDTLAAEVRAALPPDDDSAHDTPDSA